MKFKNFFMLNNILYITKQKKIKNHSNKYV